ncbi:SAM-dependent methyltransferase, partial [Streptomyces clavuligerus]
STPSDTLGTPGITAADAVVATNHHYDLPPEVFATFLGERMKYTCGLYGTADLSLDEAQTAKLRFIARRLGLRGGERVLDIGAGWGSLTCYLAAEYGCEVVAVTPSRVQIDHLTERAARLGLGHRVTTDRRSVYDLDPDGSFDAVALVGVIEHLPDHHAALATAARSLRPGGHLYVSASCYRSQWHRAVYAPRPASRDVAENIFGHADLRPLSALLAAVEDTGLSLVSTTDLTRDYRRTVRAWADNVRAARTRVDALVPGLADKLLRYLETTEAGWGRTTKHYAFTAVRSRWGHHEETA